MPQRARTHRQTIAKPKPRPRPRGFNYATGSRWRKVRAMALRREPLCRHCANMGRTVVATQVDHITPISRGGAPYDVANLQSLCASCHSKKTATVDRQCDKGMGDGES